MRQVFVLLAIVGSLAFSFSHFAVADELQTNKTVIGPTSPAVADGVAALQAGDAETAIPLLKRGLKQVSGERNFVITLSNICAAYVLLESYADAMTYCNRALDMRPAFWRALNNRALAHLGAGRYAEAKADIEHGLSLAPEANSLNKTRLRYEQIVNPVVPVIVIDDRKIDRLVPESRDRSNR